MHAGALVRALRASGADVHIRGVGGDRLRAEGAELLYDVRDTAVMGFSEVVRRLGFFRGMFRAMLEDADRHRPDLALLVDYPGFNLRFARALHARGVRVLYYVCPQVWAWHRSRIPTMARDVDRLLVIFPFEVGAFAGTGLRVDFVGHPSLEEAHAGATREAWFAGNGLDPGKPLLGLFPGSRRMEIRHILPAFAEAAELLRREVPGLQAALSLVEPGEPSWAVRLARAHPAVRLVREDRYNLAAHADALLVKSGTSTVEAAVLGTPMVVVYRGPHLATFLARRLHRLPFISLPNIVAGEAIVPEIIQYGATPRALADAVKPLLDRTNPARARMVEGLGKVRGMLGDGNASEKVARIAAEMMGWREGQGT
jgi:lipid-A-disaccharide synthase